MNGYDRWQDEQDELERSERTSITAPITWGLVFLGLILTLLKLRGMIDISWIIVLAPFWIIPAVLYAIVIGACMAFLVMIIGAIVIGIPLSIIRSIKGSK
jgi:hypothetical protein